MDNLSLDILFPIALLVAPVLAYFAHRDKWKIAEIF